MAQAVTAPRGTQDIVPPDSRRWSDVEARVRSLAGRFGYGEIRTPAFESTELFVRGVGDATDIVEKEMYSFRDRSDRELTLRPEWTAPVVRAALERRLLDGEARLFYIGPIFRYERPQKGRYRQSHQFGVECFGVAGPEADAEVISMAWELTREYALNDVILNINTIGDAACRPVYRQRLLDHFRPHLPELSEESRRRLERNPLRVLDSKDPADRPFVATAPAFEDSLCEACRDHFEAVKAYLDAIGIPYVVNSKIVRGLDYYNRTVFEITSGALGAQSTVCGGGRYDGLVKELGGPAVPAVGFALGLERFLLVVEAAGASAEPARDGIQAIALGQAALTELFPVIVELRRTLQRPVYADYSDRKLLAQLKVADRNRARYALVAGSDELAAGRVLLRDLEDRSERALPLESPERLAQAVGAIFAQNEAPAGSRAEA
jgi:histidyl-tRNA synthetase